MIIKNMTGGIASLPSVNAVDVADGATIDLLEVVGSPAIPRNFAGDLYRDVALYEAVSSGAWVVVNEGADLTVAEGLARVTSSSVARDGSFSIPYTTVTPNPASKADFDVPGLVWPVAEGESIDVTARLRFIFGTASDASVAGAPVEFSARRRTGGSTVIAQPWSISYEESVSQFRVRVYVAGDEVRVAARRGGTRTVRVRCTGTKETIKL